MASLYQDLPSRFHAGTNLQGNHMHSSQLNKFLPQRHLNYLLLYARPRVKALCQHCTGLDGDISSNADFFGETLPGLSKFQ